MWDLNGIPWCLDDCRIVEWLESLSPSVGRVSARSLWVVAWKPQHDCSGKGFKSRLQFEVEIGKAGKVRTAYGMWWQMYHAHTKISPNCLWENRKCKDGKQASQQSQFRLGSSKACRDYSNVHDSQWQVHWQCWHCSHVPSESTVVLCL